MHSAMASNPDQEQAAQASEQERHQQNRVSNEGEQVGHQIHPSNWRSLTVSTIERPADMR